MKCAFILWKVPSSVKCTAGAMILAGLAALCSAGLPPAGITQHRPRASTLKIIQLPEANLTGSLSVEEALAKQSTAGWARKFSGQALKPAQIGQLAWAGFATIEKLPQAVAPTANRSRTPPQDSEAYPIQLYLAT